MTSPTRIYLIRHGEAQHNIDRTYPHPDPPLTPSGIQSALAIQLPVAPDLILISPMTRTIDTALHAFPSLRDDEGRESPGPAAPPPIRRAAAQIWPDLRETHSSAPCNTGSPRATLQAVYPHLDFTECHAQWDYAAFTPAAATARAARVRARLKGLVDTGLYACIAVVTHRGFLAFLAKGRRFGNCEARRYRFANSEEEEDQGVRRGLNCDSLERQDFGPEVLVFVEGVDGIGEVS